MSRLDTRWKNTVWSRRNSGRGAVRLWLTTSQKILHIGQHLRKSCPRNSVDAYCCSVLLGVDVSFNRMVQGVCLLAAGEALFMRAAEGFWRAGELPGLLAGIGASRGFAAMGVQARASHTNTHTHKLRRQTGRKSRKPPGWASAHSQIRRKIAHQQCSPHLINPIQEGCFS